MLKIDNEFKIRVQYEWMELKKKGYQNNKVYIKEIPPKGMGVFANKDLEENEIIEFCHSFLANTPTKFMYDNNITEYALPGNIDNETYPCFAFGLGCVYNSADSDNLRNVDWHVFPESKLSVFIANKKIKKDEELLGWFGEGFYKSRCLPNQENIILKEFHEKINSELEKVILPNNKNLLDDSIKKLLKIDIINKNSINIDLGITDLNKEVKEDCEKVLKNIKELQKIHIYDLDK
jgi:hypothetical protein